MKGFVVFLIFSAHLAAQASGDGLAQKAVEAERSGDFQQAISLFKQLIREGDDSPELRGNLGIAYYQSGDFQSALREFQRALTKSPDFVSANLFCGMALLKLQQPKQALHYLSKAKRVQPDDAVTLSAMAQAEVATNQISSANESFRKVTRIDPSDAQAWYGRGITDRLLAEATLKSAKRGSEAANAGGLTQRSQELMSDFEKSVQTAMQIDPGSVRASMILGESFRIAERYEEAIREYKLATTQSPELASSWAGLAAAESASGNDRSALQAGLKALEIDANDSETNTLVAAIYIRMGDLAKAEPFSRKALRLNPALPGGHVVLAKLYLADHQPQKAVPELQAAAKDDLDGSTHYLLATTLRQLGRSNESAAAMQKYERLHRSHVPAASQ